MPIGVYMTKANKIDLKKKDMQTIMTKANKILSKRDRQINIPVKRLVDSSALGLPMDYLGPIACDSLAIQLITASTGASDVLQ